MIMPGQFHNFDKQITYDSLKFCYEIGDWVHKKWKVPARFFIIIFINKKKCLGMMKLIGGAATT